MGVKDGNQTRHQGFKDYFFIERLGLFLLGKS
jgi:hypothetical protein